MEEEYDHILPLYHLCHSDPHLTQFLACQAGMEEYYDYIFPDEAAAAPNLKILEAAYKWKKQKTGDADAEA